MGLVFQTIAGFKGPTDDAKANRKKHKSHSQADTDTDIRSLVKTPTKAADQVHHWIEQS